VESFLMVLCSGFIRRSRRGASSSIIYSVHSPSGSAATFGRRWNKEFRPVKSLPVTYGVEHHNLLCNG
jgi:hypothetical protein